MRLTLRTLLAYLDDTLEPGEIKTIGQKVAESDAAQELVARIKQVTRRRRLTTPTDGGPGERFDANRVAAYLDNELSAEEIADLEKICLDSDVHLAEIAATHQILTLVLGEPALVPPTAKRRMYALLHGRPSKASTKTPPVTKTAGVESPAIPEGDPDDALLALPLFRKAPWLRWALPLAAVVLLGVLGVVLWNTLGGTENRVASRPDDTGKDGLPEDKDKVKQADSTKQPDKDKPADGSKSTDKDKAADSSKSTDKDKKPADKDKKIEPEPVKVEIPVVGKANMERHPIGSFASKEQVLVQHGPDGWKRIGLAEPVQTGEQLVSLPGYKSKVDLDGKVSLLLWGSLPELFPEFLLESSVTFHHQPAPGLDLEMTLHRGRTYLTNLKDKGETRIRLRFWRGEVWDVTLDDPDTMVGVELMTIPVELIPSLLPGYKPQKDEEPLIQVAFYILKGKASLKGEGKTYGELRGPTGRALFLWNNKGRGLDGPLNVDRKIVEWDPEQPLPTQPRDLSVAKAINVALSELALHLTDPKKRVSTALYEYMEEKEPEKRLLGIRSLVAIDSVDLLLDALGRDDLKRDDVRREALYGLKNWLSRGLEQFSKLYDRKTMTGMLKDKDYSNIESQIILDLLQGYSPEERRLKATYEDLITYLRHSKLLIRELAIRQLTFLAPGLKIDYNPFAPMEARDAGYAAWKNLLDTGKLPPPPPRAPPPPMP